MVWSSGAIKDEDALIPVSRQSEFCLTFQLEKSAKALLRLLWFKVTAVND
jgi:hypothetical protein